MSVADIFSDDGSSLLSTLLVVVIAAFALLFLKGFFEGQRNQHGAPPNRSLPLPNTNNRNTEAAGGGMQQLTGMTPPATTTATASSQRGGIRAVTISAPGVLLEERNPESFSEGATVLHSAIATLQAAMLKGGGSCSSDNDISSSLLANTNVYILCQVSDDIGEAAVRAALEFSGLMGSNQGQIQSQRFLFCETLVGKMSLVRQIEPEVHIDGDSSTVEQLKRFIPRLIQVQNLSSFSKNEGGEESISTGVVVVDNFEHAMKILSS
ncbi:hypothetical protein KSW81_005420 [Nannochloris sp. 'desiccata']|nr:hypothetical protein KSW81_005420 [Chlorella desiccata (nom. nud.)]